MKKDISILGCGWLGLALGKKLVKAGCNVKGSTTSPEKIKRLNEVEIEPFKVDISQEIEKNNAFFSSEIMIIAVTSKSSTDFKRLIAQIEASTIKRVIFVSSTSVYPSNNQVVTEESETVHTKLFQIEELFRHNVSFKTTVIRFGGLFGFDRVPGKFHPSGKRIPNPEGFVNLIHRDDCIGIIKEIINQEVWGETFNGCCDSHPKRRAFYGEQRLLLGITATLFREEDANTYKIVSCKKVIEKLKYTFIHSDLLQLTTE
jgi:nucleoside-diphosphate-sugar epimerase